MNQNNNENLKSKIAAPKIDVVMRYFLPVTAGIEINVWQTYRTLVKTGWDVTLHVTKDTYTEKNILPDEEIIDGIKIKRYQFKPLGFKPDIDWQKTDAICLHNFDIFPHLWIMLKTIYLKLRGKKNFALFVTPHGGFCPEWSVFSFAQKLIKKTYTNTFGLYLLNRTADGIRAVSPWEADEMVHIGVDGSLIQVVTNGLEDEAYQNIEDLASEKIKNTVKGITYIMDNSRLKPIKDIETIIRALALLPDYVHFVHIGTTQDESYREFMLNLANSLGLKDRVHFLGVIRGIDKYYLYKHAAVFVHPAIWEANANVVHEAWSQRLVTIVGDSTGMRAQVKNEINGFLVPLRDSKKLSELILNSLENKDSAFFESLRDANMEYVRTHAWREVGKRMGEFYLSKMSNKFIDLLLNPDLNLEFHNRITQIIENKLPCYFISPHLDDAVYSSGSLIEYLAKYTKVSVISVFTESNNQKTLSIRSFLRQCGFKNAVSLFENRREEDISVCKSIGVNHIHLGFLDAPWRTKKVGTFRSFLAWLLPELKAVYPTHKFHISNGVVSSADDLLINDIRLAIEKEIGNFEKNNFAIFGPAGVGRHVDHIIVRDICREMFLDPIFWLDVPYINNGQKPKKNHMLGDMVARENSENKIEILKGYKSQFKAMFGGKDINLLPELFYFSKNKTEKPKISVGIPAYNEEDNIGNLIESLLLQKTELFELSEIIVCSDGSTDGTAQVVNEIKSGKVRLFDSKERKGAVARQNEILKIFQGDILVLLNADILPKDSYFLANMVLPFMKNEKIGIVSNRGIPIKAESFFEKIINFSFSWKSVLLESLNKGNNIYTCHGHSRAFSRSLAEKFIWPANVIAEDAYSYIRAQDLGYEFYYEKRAEIYFRSPQTFMDHIKQSSRFLSSKRELSNYFGSKVVSGYFRLPKGLTIKNILTSTIKNPFFSLSYAVIVFYACFDSRFKNRANVTWEPSKSSKKLIKK